MKGNTSIDNMALTFHYFSFADGVASWSQLPSLVSFNTRQHGVTRKHVDLYSLGDRLKAKRTNIFQYY